MNTKNNIFQKIILFEFLQWLLSLSTTSTQRKLCIVISNLTIFFKIISEINKYFWYLILALLSNPILNHWHQLKTLWRRFMHQLNNQTKMRLTHHMIFGLLELSCTISWQKNYLFLKLGSLKGLLLFKKMKEMNFQINTLKALKI